MFFVSCSPECCCSNLTLFQGIMFWRLSHFLCGQFLTHCLVILSNNGRHLFPVLGAVKTTFDILSSNFVELFSTFLWMMQCSFAFSTVCDTFWAYFFGVICNFFGWGIFQPRHIHMWYFCWGCACSYAWHLVDLMYVDWHVYDKLGLFWR